MLQEILSSEKCVECKKCCFFDQNEKWEAPEPLLPPKAELFGCMPCCHLSENGCKLGSGKPIECAMYPFRIMQVGECKAIALSRYCKAVSELPLCRIMEFIDKKAAEFFALSEKHPDIIKEYNQEYVILRNC